MEFQVLGTPVGKHRPRFSTVHGYAQAIKQKEDVYYENLVKLCFSQAKPEGYDLYEKPLKVEIRAFFDIPKAFSKKRTKEALEGCISPLKKPDADNIAKIICDALNGVAYKDDVQIVELVVRKCYAEMPSVSVIVEEFRT